MPAKAGEPLFKTTLNLYEADVVKLRHHLGHGWAAEVREWVHEKMRSLPAPAKYEPYTWENFDDE